MSSPDAKLSSFLTSLSTSEVVTVLAVAVIAVPVVRIAETVVRPYFSALNSLPGPKGHYILGNSKDISKLDNGSWHEQMIQQYGPVLVYQDPLGVRYVSFAFAFRKVTE